MAAVIIASYNNGKQIAQRLLNILFTWRIIAENDEILRNIFLQALACKRCVYKILKHILKISNSINLSQNKRKQISCISIDCWILHGKNDSKDDEFITATNMASQISRNRGLIECCIHPSLVSLPLYLPGVAESLVQIHEVDHATAQQRDESVTRRKRMHAPPCCMTLQLVAHIGTRNQVGSVTLFFFIFRQRFFLTQDSFLVRLEILIANKKIRLTLILVTKLQVSSYSSDRKFIIEINLHINIYLLNIILLVFTDSTYVTFIKDLRNIDNNYLNIS